MISEHIRCTSFFIPQDVIDILEGSDDLLWELIDEWIVAGELIYGRS